MPLPNVWKNKCHNLHEAIEAIEAIGAVFFLQWWNKLPIDGIGRTPLHCQWSRSAAHFNIDSILFRIVKKVPGTIEDPEHRPTDISMLCWFQFSCVTIAVVFARKRSTTVRFDTVSLKFGALNIATGSLKVCRLAAAKYQRRRGRHETWTAVM